MSKCRIHGDCWDGIDNTEWHVLSASAEDLDQALDRLDARTYTMLTIAGDGEQHLAIGGGGGRYVVYATFDNERFWNLLRSEPVDGVELVTAGGQEGEYPAMQVVTLSQARAAGRVFLDAGKLDPDQEWGEQD